MTTEQLTQGLFPEAHVFLELHKKKLFSSMDSKTLNNGLHYVGDMDFLVACLFPVMGKLCRRHYAGKRVELELSPKALHKMEELMILFLQKVVSSDFKFRCMRQMREVAFSEALKRANI